MTNYQQADTETRTRAWSLTDEAGDPIVPSAITFYARDGATDVTWTTGTGVVDSGDGTGTWKITAGDLDPGKYVWWALVTKSDGDVVIPDDMTGTLEIIDR